MRCNDCVLLAQQAAEKALKALLLKCCRKLIRIHELTDLIKNIRKCGLRVPEYMKLAARELEPHYEASRYPDVTTYFFQCVECQVAYDTYTPEISEYCIDQAEKIVRWVVNEIKSLR